MIVGNGHEPRFGRACDPRAAEAVEHAPRDGRYFKRARDPWPLAVVQERLVLFSLRQAVACTVP